MYRLADAAKVTASKSEKSADVVDIFDEVSDDLRAEKAARLARRYGMAALGAAALVVLAVAAQQGWAWWQGQQNDKAATAYLALSQQVQDAGTAITNPQRIKLAQAEQSFAATAPQGYRSLAALQAASLYAAAGEGPQALAAWDAVARDVNADPLLRDAANLLWVQHALGTLPDAAVAARLQPLTVETNPYHGLAQETQAVMLMEQGKTDLAKAVLLQLASDSSAPSGVRNRANGLLAKLNG